MIYAEQPARQRWQELQKVVDLPNWDDLGAPVKDHLVQALNDDWQWAERLWSLSRSVVENPRDVPFWTHLPRHDRDAFVELVRAPTR